MPTHHLACDLGASSGRVMLGTLTEGRLELEEIYRFKYPPLPRPDGLRWDLPAIQQGIETGLRLAAARVAAIDSISVDSWGVDYVLLDAAGEPLDLPFVYRDPRTAAPFARIAADPARAALLYAETGIAPMEINTVYQLVADLEQRPELLARAARFFNIADYLNFWLGGEARAERSLASTTQLYNPRTRTWSGAVQEALGLPARIFPELVDSGTRLGLLRSPLAELPALARTQIVATCSHDTGAAVAAVPAEPGTGAWAYLSSGTWSLLGVEIAAPILTEAAHRAGCTNEVGFNGTVRFQKNLIGLWLLQECQRAWAKAGLNLSDAALVQEAELRPDFTSLILPDWPGFQRPGPMPSKIAEFCRATGQVIPQTPGEFARVIFESLALLYAETLEQVSELTGLSCASLHVVGGGSKNNLLNLLTQSAINRTLLVGPVEATACGNLLLQAYALGQFAFPQAIRSSSRAFAAAASEPVRPQSPAALTHPPDLDPAGTAAKRQRYRTLQSGQTNLK